MVSFQATNSLQKACLSREIDDQDRLEFSAGKQIQQFGHKQLYATIIPQVFDSRRPVATENRARLPTVFVIDGRKSSVAVL